jgi:hypothetical protein
MHRRAIKFHSPICPGGKSGESLQLFYSGIGRFNFDPEGKLPKFHRHALGVTAALGPGAAAAVIVQRKLLDGYCFSLDPRVVRRKLAHRIGCGGTAGMAAAAAK